MRKLRILNNRGDTIVEVMIVLAVLGLAIGISYATANRSLLNARQAQESSQATEVVQGQVEALRANVGNASMDNNYIYRNEAFCFDSSGTLQVASDSTCNLGEAGRYHTTIHWGGTSDDTFTVQATWDDILEAGVTDSATVSYRVHTAGPSVSHTGGQTGGSGDQGGDQSGGDQGGDQSGDQSGGQQACPTGQTGTPPNCTTPDQGCTILGIKFPPGSIVCRFGG